MGRSLSPVLKQELENLEKDADSRKSAMKALKSYVKDLDSKSISLFLAQVSETKQAGSSPGEHTISLYEVLARVHGPNIVSQIDNIMSSIIRTLTTSGGSFPLQQACSKVVPAIARYGIEPTTPEDKKRKIIHSLCKPLSDSLLCSQESLSCGAALCLKALVDCDNWRFASDDMVNEVCLKLASALEDKATQTNSHMGLVMSLAKRNSLTVEAYAHLLILAGLRILNCGQAERNSQKRLTAIQMVHYLMKCLDIGSICQELEFIMEEMEKCQSDQMPYVKGAAFEALQTAKKLLVEKVSKLDSDVISVTGSNFGRSGNSRSRQLLSPSDRSPISGSPESQTLDSFAEYESFLESPLSMTQSSCNVNHARKNVNRKLWNHENGYVDISLKDGLFSELARESSRSYSSSEQDGHYDIRRGYVNGFPGFVQGRSAANGGSLRSGTPSPQRSRSQINLDSVRIFTTPRKLVRSLQDDDDDENSNYPDNQARRHRSPCSGKCEWSPVAKYTGNGHSNEAKQKNGSSDVTDSESVLSTEEVAVNNDREVHREAFQRGENKSQDQKLVKSPKRKTVNLLLFIILALSAVFASVMWFDGQSESINFVPT